ncbi:hypothetical protein MNBD_CHLOROFLEXI01-2648 [hydrothermal vent metagenome]|uniref:Uncharacterized protein n=1 Tax=hydrothermal vent metagenome TaxID=652676 RepID=A0A3B0VBS4_9ZZZZ
MIHLFSLGEAAWGAFHDAHVLKELDFQPNLVGMIVVIDRESVLYLLERKAQEGDNSVGSFGQFYFSWLEKQRLPYVIAAAGCQGSKAKLEQLRTALKLSSNIPMIPGPSLWKSNNLLFDTEHANKVLSALNDILKIGDLGDPDTDDL